MTKKKAKGPARKPVKRSPVKKKVAGKRTRAKKKKKKAKSAPRKKKASTAARKPKAEKKITVRIDAQKELRESLKKGSKGIIDSNRMADLDFDQAPRIFLSTGSLELDRALTPTWMTGRSGGIPMGRLTEVLGPAHIGKTTLLDSIFASVQRIGGIGVLVETDTERDPVYTKAIGVDLESLEKIEFNSWDVAHMENAMDAMIDTIAFFRKRAPDIPMVVGIDALGVTPTAKEIENSISQGTTASAAKVLRRSCRKIAGVLSGTNSAMVVLNHEYQQIGFGGPHKPNAAYGGNAVELLATVRFRLHRVKEAFIKDSAGGVIIGRKVGYDLQKFKMGHAFKAGEFVILHSVGIDNVWTILERLKAHKLVDSNGSWSAINVDGDQINFQGYVSLRNKCLEHPELFPKLEAAYRSTL